MAVGEIALVADAMKAGGENVEQEAPDELFGVERHHLALVVVTIVLPEEADPAVGQLDRRLLAIATRWMLRPRYSSTCPGPPKGRLA